VLFSALVSDDEDADELSAWYAADEPACWDVGADSNWPLEAYQLGSSVGIFATPHVAAGARLVAQTNAPDDPVRSFWGIGPELTLYPGSASCPLRPFVSYGHLFVRSRMAHGRHADGTLATTSHQVRAGCSWLGPNGGFFFQASYQGRPVDGRHARVPTRSGWGAGMGLIVYPALAR